MNAFPFVPNGGIFKKKKEKKETSAFPFFRGDIQIVSLLSLKRLREHTEVKTESALFQRVANFRFVDSRETSLEIIAACEFHSGHVLHIIIYSIIYREK